MATDTRFVEYLTSLIIQEIELMGHKVAASAAKFVPVGISARHVHLQPDHLERLFGKGYKLTPLKELSQPGQFAASETVVIEGPKGKIEKVRILGPERKSTQVEVSASDARTLGVLPIVRNSGDHEGTPGLRITGPVGSIEISRGVIVADRHVHMSPEEAELFGTVNGDKVKFLVLGPKGGVIDNVTVRVHKDYRLDLHVDTDDGNAFLLAQGDMLEFIR